MLVAKKLDPQIDNGEKSAAAEIPIILSLDEDPFFEEPPPSWCDRVNA